MKFPFPFGFSTPDSCFSRAQSEIEARIARRVERKRKLDEEQVNTLSSVMDDQDQWTVSPCDGEAVWCYVKGDETIFYSRVERGGYSMFPYTVLYIGDPALSSSRVAEPKERSILAQAAKVLRERYTDDYEPLL